MVNAELLQYNIAYDQKEKDVNFIAKQLEAHLRERFNVLVSTAEYEIKDDHLVREGTQEPFIESIKRGRDIIQRLSPNEIDFERENAEVTGFEKIDAFFANRATLLNSKMLLISPKGDGGSKYQHNFYDIFTLKEVQGKRYVELARYSSGLSKEEYTKRLGLDFKDPPQANPIQFATFTTPERIHEALHIQHEYMAPMEFEKIWNSALVQFCVERYEANRDARTFNAVLNAADKVWKNNDRKREEQTYQNYSMYGYRFFCDDVKYLEEKKVRQAGGQCPGKSGADIDDFPFSVSEFAEPDRYGDRIFECPECGKTNVRPKDKLLKNCQHCGSSKVAC